MPRKFDGTFRGGAFENAPGLWDALKGKASPELLRALHVVLGALIESGSRVDPRTAAAGLDRKNWPKRHCRSTHIQGDRCELHGSHGGDHRGASGKTWHRAQRVKKTRAKKKAKRQ